MFFCPTPYHLSALYVHLHPSSKVPLPSSVPRYGHVRDPSKLIQSPQCHTPLSPKHGFRAKSSPCKFIICEILYSGTRLESRLLVFFVFSVCSHVYLGQNWLKSGDKIQIPSTITIIPSAARNNGRVVLGA